MTKLCLLFCLLGLFAPGKAAALSQHGYVRGSNGTTPIVQAKVYIRNNATGAVGSTVSQYPYGDWHFYNIVSGRSYTYWATYQPLVCVHPATVLRYYTAQFTKTAWDNSYGALGIWNVGQINLEGATYISC